jgi:hypothetical protein
MNTNSRTSRRLAAGCLAAAAVVAGLAAATPATGTSYPANDAAYSFDPASLPRTPDAVEGWYAHNRSIPMIGGNFTPEQELALRMGYYIPGVGYNVPDRQSLNRVVPHLKSAHIASPAPAEVVTWLPADPPQWWRVQLDDVGY